MYLALISEQTYGIPHHITNLSKQTEGLRDVNAFIENTNTFHTEKKKTRMAHFSPQQSMKERQSLQQYVLGM